VFLLVPAHPGSPGQRAVKRLLCCCCTLVEYPAIPQPSFQHGIVSDTRSVVGECVTTCVVQSSYPYWPLCGGWLQMVILYQT